MRGFCGWLEFDSPASSVVEVVRRMAGGEPATNITSDQRWATKTNSQPDTNLSAYFGNGGFSIVEGSPTSANSEFSACTSQHGLARACQTMYQKYGAGFIADLHGPFCVAISLDNESRFLLAVDRVGIRPVFYSLAGTGLAFASRLGHLHGCSKLDLTIDPQSVYDYLYYHVIPSPNTIFRNIKSLPPGTYLEVCEGRSRISQYWQVEYSREDASLDLGQLKNEFKDVLHQCVRREAELTPDVGCFLSGGTDSSTLAGVLGDVTKRRVSTYSIGFNQKGYDEMEYARLAAAHFNTDHHEYYVTPDDILNIVPKISQAYG